MMEFGLLAMTCSYVILLALYLQGRRHLEAANRRTDKAIEVIEEWKKIAGSFEKSCALWKSIAESERTIAKDWKRVAREKTQNLN